MHGWAILEYDPCNCLVETIIHTYLYWPCIQKEDPEAPVELRCTPLRFVHAAHRECMQNLPLALLQKWSTPDILQALAGCAARNTWTDQGEFSPEMAVSTHMYVCNTSEIWNNLQSTHEHDILYKHFVTHDHKLRELWTRPGDWRWHHLNATLGLPY